MALFSQHLATVVQKLDNAIHSTNDLYPVDNAIGFPDTYPLDSDWLWRYPTFEQPATDLVY